MGGDPGATGLPGPSCTECDLVISQSNPGPPGSPGNPGQMGTPGKRTAAEGKIIDVMVSLCVSP